MRRTTSVSELRVKAGDPCTGRGRSYVRCRHDLFTDPTATDLAARRAAVLVANADYLPAPRPNAAAAPTTAPSPAAAAAVGPGSR